MFRKHIILLNGPPRVGKDSIAEKFIEYCAEDVNIPKNIISCKFADSIKDHVFATFKHITPDNYDLVKDKPIFDMSTRADVLDETGAKPGSTLREWMINYAEVYMKPKFGNAIFGKQTCAKIKQKFSEGVDYVLVTDLGFLEEFEEILREFKHDPTVIVLAKIRKRDIGFDGDSRKYITDEDIDSHEFESIRNFDVCTIDNNGRLIDAVIQLVSHLYEIADEAEFIEKNRVLHYKN
jgi:hypothetical protein